MGSYGVIKEALLVKQNGSTAEYSVVQKLVPATVNGMVSYNGKGGFELSGKAVFVNSICHGGAFGFSEWFESGNIYITVNIPGSGVKRFTGKPLIENVRGVGQCVKCSPEIQDPNAPYTHLCLVVESPDDVFAESFG